MLRYLSYIVIAALATGCGGKKVLSPTEYLSYVGSKDSKLRVNRELSDIGYHLQMITPAQQALSEITEEGIKSQAFHEAMHYYKDKLNFVLVIDDAGPGLNKVKSAVFDKASYGKMLSYANTNLKEDFFLVQGNDTILSSMTHLESANSIEPKFRIALSFNNVDTTSKDYTLVFNDKIFNNGPIKFYYSADVMSSLPEIKM